MIECDYCGDEFADEESYRAHLEASHVGELGPIDRRKLETRPSSDGGGSRTVSNPIGSISRSIPGGSSTVILVIAVGLILFGIYSLSGAITVGGVHDHGQLLVEIDEDRVDFDQPEYNDPDRFHFHSGDGETWHMHPDRLTFEEAMAELGIPVTETSITVDGTTYDDEDAGTSVEMSINGEPADLDRELHDGDTIEIIVET